MEGLNIIRDKEPQARSVVLLRDFKSSVSLCVRVSVDAIERKVMR